MSINTNFLTVSLRSSPSQSIVSAGLNVAQVVDASSVDGVDFRIEGPADLSTSTDTVMLVTSDGYSKTLTRQGDYWRLTVGPDDFGGAGTAPGTTLTKTAQFVVERLVSSVWTRWASQDFTLKIDRQIGFAPKGVAGLLAWYDAYDLLATANGTTLSAWSDKSDYARNLAQATGANQPAKQTWTNLRPYVLFDGSNDSMASTLGGLTGSLTVFIAQVFRSSDATVRASVHVGGVGGPRVAMDNTNISGRSASDAATTAKPTDDVWHIATVTKNTSNVTVQLGTGSPASAASVGSITAGVLELGDTTADAAANVGIGEVLVYNSVLGASEINRIVRALSAKWGA